MIFKSGSLVEDLQGRDTLGYEARAGGSEEWEPMRAQAGLERQERSPFHDVGPSDDIILSKSGRSATYRGEVTGVDVASERIGEAGRGGGMSIKRCRRRGIPGKS